MSHWIQYPHLTFDETTHIYLWKGKKTVSVTQIFNRLGYRKNDESPWVPFGCPEFAKQDKAKNFGAALHKVANAVSVGLDVKYPDVMKPYVKQVESFLSDNNISIITDNNKNAIAEYPMYSTRCNFSGTNDLFGRHLNSGSLIIVDWKSSSIYQKSYSWQTAGYEILIRELFGGMLFDRREKILRTTVLISTNGYNAVYGDARDKSSFLSLLNTYKLTA